MNAIEFDHVGKLYHLGSVGTGTLSHDLNRWWQTRVLRHEDPYLKVGETNDRTHKGKSDFVWALRDISFQVGQGEVVGIIGKNGAGKSTLLKLLSRVTAPTTGEIRARGRIASLLEVGTGFHQEMTGRENIYMNGAIMGMTRAEIQSKLDAIVDFAGVERYLDTPVKRYSSGMTVRLGFAVAAFLEPEILVVDEVLAVGDAEFQKKAVGKMQDVSRGEGRTVLFVSHNMAAVRSLCQRGIVLEKGGVVFDGGVEEAVEYYLRGEISSDYGTIIQNITFQRDYLSTSEIRINGTDKVFSAIKKRQECLDIEIKGTTTMALTCDIKFIIKKMDGTPMAALVEGRYKGDLFYIPEGDFSIKKSLRLPKYIADGQYMIDLYLSQPMVQELLVATNCMVIQFEGFYDPYTNPLYLSKEGFIGLESVGEK
ncbi:MAG: ABC transporter ATP-binding protein [Bacteroidales bacterium]|nr:ABC transporter ATP-binding protein [Bacteroidales bacterium]